MTTANDTTYLDRLAAALRTAGRSEAEITATVADLSSYVTDGDGGAHGDGDGNEADLAEEFGAPEEFAARLTEDAPGEEPAAAAEEWKWTCDLYTDRELLNRYGDEGWEVERIDRLGRFVCHRDPSAALRWEYRREIANNTKERAALTAELAPDGWEPGGHWMYCSYFKRPKAASEGPAAGLDAVPTAPRERILWGPRVRRLMLVAALLAVLLAVAFTTGFVDLTSPFIRITLPCAVVVGGVLGWYGSRRDARMGVADLEK